MAEPQPQHGKRSNGRVIAWCMAGVVGMFAFGFALVPLYDVFCEITGINGKTGGRYDAQVTNHVDANRTVTVQFLASNGPGMSWEFRPVTRSIKVHPGEHQQGTDSKCIFINTDDAQIRTSPVIASDFVKDIAVSVTHSGSVYVTGVLTHIRGK